MQIDPMDDFGELDEGDVFDELSAGMQQLVAMSQQQAQAIAMLAQSVQQLTALMAAPKRVVRDPMTQRVVGVAPDFGGGE